MKLLIIIISAAYTSLLCFSLVVIVVVVPLVLYKIHVATNHLVLEGDNLRHWYIVNR